MGARCASENPTTAARSPSPDFRGGKELGCRYAAPCRARPPGRAGVAFGTSPEPTQNMRHRRLVREAEPYKAAERIPSLASLKTQCRQPDAAPCRARPPGRAGVAFGISPEPTQNVRYRRLVREAEPYKAAERIPSLASPVGEGKGVRLIAN